MNPKNIVDNESYIYSRRCIVFVGANSFARQGGYVRMNSHLRAPQLRF